MFAPGVSRQTPCPLFSRLSDRLDRGRPFRARSQGKNRPAPREALATPERTSCRLALAALLPAAGAMWAATLEAMAMQPAEREPPPELPACFSAHSPTDFRSASAPGQRR